MEQREGSDWDQTYIDAGYAWCRPHGEWHRPPECPIDESGNANPVWLDAEVYLADVSSLNQPRPVSVRRRTKGRHDMTEPAETAAEPLASATTDNPRSALSVDSGPAGGATERNGVTRWQHDERLPDPPCPKCGHPDTAMRYCDGKPLTRQIGDRCLEREPDHFHRRCKRCHYQWQTGDVLSR